MAMRRQGTAGSQPSPVLTSAAPTSSSPYPMGSPTSSLLDNANTTSFSPSSTKTPTHLVEFQAVVLAGGDGAQLHPLVGDSSSEKRTPKSLMPVCNRPLLYYQLKMLEKAGFSEVIVATDEVYRPAFQSFLSHYKADAQKENRRTFATVELFHPSLSRIEQHANEDVFDQSEFMGTAETLRQLRSRLRAKDLVVIAGDLICEIALNNLIDVHRTEDASLTMLLKEQYKPDKTHKGAIVQHSAPEILKTFVGLEKLAGRDHERVVFTASSREREDGNLCLGRSLLVARPRFTVHTDLADAHLYVMKRWTLDVIHKERFTSLRHDLVPFLVTAQFKGGIRSQARNIGSSEIWKEAESSQAEAHRLTSQPWLAPQDGDRIRVYARVSKYHRNTGGEFCARASTLEAYAAMNLSLFNHAVAPGATPWEPFVSVPPERVVEDRSGASAGSSVATAPTSSGRPAPAALEAINTLFGARCSVHATARIKSCIVGEGCVIGSGCKLESCVLLEGCRVEDGAVLVGCVLGAGVVVGRDCRLERVRVETKLRVADEAVHVFKAGKEPGLLTQEEGDDFSDDDDDDQ